MSAIQFGSRIRVQLPENKLSAQGAVNIIRSELGKTLYRRNQFETLTPQDTFHLLARTDGADRAGYQESYVEAVCLDERDELVKDALVRGLQGYDFAFKDGIPDLQPVKLQSCRNEADLAQAISQSQQDAAKNLPFRLAAEAYAETISNIRRQADGSLYLTSNRQQINPWNTF